MEYENKARAANGSTADPEVMHLAAMASLMRLVQTQTEVITQMHHMLVRMWWAQLGMILLIGVAALSYTWPQ